MQGPKHWGVLSAFTILRAHGTASTAMPSVLSVLSACYQRAISMLSISMLLACVSYRCLHCSTCTTLTTHSWTSSDFGRRTHPPWYQVRTSTPLDPFRPGWFVYPIAHAHAHAHARVNAICFIAEFVCSWTCSPFKKYFSVGSHELLPRECWKSVFLASEWVGVLAKINPQLFPASSGTQLQEMTVSPYCFW